MLEILKLLHFIGIILGIGGGLANAISAVRLAGLPPETGPIVGGFRQTLGKMSTIGLVILWLSGIALIINQKDAGLLSDTLFLLKLGAVIVLSGFSIAANITVISAKKAGGPPDAKRMENLGKGALLSGTVALVLAVLVFN